MDPEVGAVFDAYPPTLRKALLELRRLILETATEADVGEIFEVLRWGQPAYLTARPRTGTTIRIGAIKGSIDRYAMYLNCKTTLMDRYRLHYPDALSSRAGVRSSCRREPCPPRRL